MKLLTTDQRTFVDKLCEAAAEADIEATTINNWIDALHMFGVLRKDTPTWKVRALTNQIPDAIRFMIDHFPGH